MKLLILILSWTMAAAWAGSRGSYAVKVPGFDFKKGHFDQVGQLEGCENAGPGLLYRGGAPDFRNPNALSTLQDKRIRLVVDLRIERANRDEEARVLAAQGIGYVRIGLTTELPVPARVPVSVRLPGEPARDEWLAPSEAAAFAVHLLREQLAAGVNAFVHCQHGEDRTGIVIGLFRDCPAWKAEFDRYGGTFYPALQKIFHEAHR